MKAGAATALAALLRGPADGPDCSGLDPELGIWNSPKTAEVYELQLQVLARHAAQRRRDLGAEELEEPVELRVLLGVAPRALTEIFTSLGARCRGDAAGSAGGPPLCVQIATLLLHDAYVGQEHARR